MSYRNLRSNASTSGKETSFILVRKKTIRFDPWSCRGSGTPSSVFHGMQIHPNLSWFIRPERRISFREGLWKMRNQKGERFRKNPRKTLDIGRCDPNQTIGDRVFFMDGSWIRPIDDVGRASPTVGESGDGSMPSTLGLVRFTDAFRSTRLQMQARALFLLLLPAVLCVRIPFSGMQREGLDSEEWVKPWFCHENECPKYKVINTTATYEVRKYAPGKWVSTDCLETNFMSAQYAGFYRLYKYITGANEANATIPMTAPVMNYVTPGLTPTAPSNITVSFYLPYDYQKVDPPAPTGPNIYIQDLPEMKVYVASFGGWAKGSTVSAQVEALQAAMEAEEVAYDKEHYFFAGYDPPFRFFDRHNEVWVQALKEEPAPSPSPSPPDVPPESSEMPASSSGEEAHADTVKVPVS